MSDWIDNAVRLILKTNGVHDAKLLRAIIETQMPEPPLLQCSYCGNTESCAGAKARAFNHGRCLHCGGYFKVLRA